MKGITKQTGVLKKLYTCLPQQAGRHLNENLLLDFNPVHHIHFF
jgi:hypothetical protein